MHAMALHMLAECPNSLPHDTLKDALKHCLENDIKPRDVMTLKAFENAVRLIMVLGGSTNVSSQLKVRVID